ncbi:hypothetical protein L7F22_053627 [Adiantum nelumboides]|nr:hypothetical protein [Adiantum nelumboides]MCO5599521.1 hypothetical protein [Adiantum nelumboides]
MIFVKDSLNGVDETQVNENGMQVELKLSNFLNQFQDVFMDDIPGELPPKRGDDDHMFELILGSSPPNKLLYRVSQAQQEEIMRQVNEELVEKGMVRPSCSPFCSPVLLVQKEDGTYRMCVDYRALNRITIKNIFPVPRVEDLFDKLQGSTYFSRIDLKSGYHQIKIVDEDVVKTAFRTTFGLYEYLVMLFGLTNTPATFNRMMERIFRPHRNFTGVFFDDVIIYSKTIEEHKEHLEMQDLKDLDMHYWRFHNLKQEMEVLKNVVLDAETKTFLFIGTLPGLLGIEVACTDLLDVKSIVDFLKQDRCFEHVDQSCASLCATHESPFADEVESHPYDEVLSFDDVNLHEESCASNIIKVDSFPYMCGKESNVIACLDPCLDNCRDEGLSSSMCWSYMLEKDFCCDVEDMHAFILDDVFLPPSDAL